MPFIKKLGHATAECESMNKDKERGKGFPTKEVLHAQKEEVVYDVEVMMMLFRDNRLPA